MISRNILQKQNYSIHISVNDSLYSLNQYYYFYFPGVIFRTHYQKKTEKRLYMHQSNCINSIEWIEHTFLNGTHFFDHNWVAFCLLIGTKTQCSAYLWRLRFLRVCLFLSIMCIFPSIDKYAYIYSYNLCYQVRVLVAWISGPAP